MDTWRRIPHIDIYRLVPGTPGSDPHTSVSENQCSVKVAVVRTASDPGIVDKFFEALRLGGRLHGGETFVCLAHSPGRVGLQPSHCGGAQAPWLRKAQT